MPTYDYQCRKCGQRFERFQKMSDAPLDTCPDCGGPVDRLIGGGTGVIMKGPGGQAHGGMSCGRDAPCCGRDAPCDHPPCH